MRQWRKDWLESYHQMLRVLREKWPDGGRGVQEFVRVLRLHEDHPAALVQKAIEQALVYGCPHLDGVLQCLHQLDPSETPSVDPQTGDHLPLPTVGTQPINLQQYEQLLRTAR
jgi:hypothetical protein